MTSSKDNDKTVANQALSRIYRGAHEMFAECVVLARYFWNMEMRLLKALGVMPLLASRAWLLVVLGFVLLAAVPPLGTVFVLTAFAAVPMEPSGENGFIVPLRKPDMMA